MIGALEGTVILKTHETIILMVHGVGYKVSMSPSLLDGVTIGKSLKLFIYTHVREDLIQLFGFITIKEHELFELLISVSGIGPKTALHIINRGEAAVKRAIINADVDFFTSIPRLGTKNSQKLIIELKSKLGSLKELDLQNDGTGETKELIDSLIGVGFTKQEVMQIIHKIPIHIETLEDKIKYCLKHLGNQR